MEILSINDVKNLIKNTNDPSVSIYLPTLRAGDTEQNPIRLKNAIKIAEQQLNERGSSPAETVLFLEPVQRLLEDAMFWRFQSDGLAIFLSSQVFQHYRLPYNFPETVYTHNRFYTRPLLPLFGENGLFYVLVLSQNKARFLQCTRYSVLEITPQAMPTSLAEALKYDEFEKQLQYHTAGPGSAVFHGQGIGKDDNKDSILRYFQQIQAGLHELLKDEHAPLVLAAVDYLHPLYRQANKYAYLMESGLVGNFDTTSETDLHRQAWPVAEKYLKQIREDTAAKYEKTSSKGFTTDNVKEAVLAAHDGRIDTLFLAIDAQQWGEYDLPARDVQLYAGPQAGAVDLLDVIAANTLVNGGAVYVSERNMVPGNTQIACLLRY